MNRFRPIFQNISVQIQHLCIYNIFFHKVESLASLPSLSLTLSFSATLFPSLALSPVSFAFVFSYVYFAVDSIALAEIFVSVTLIAYAREC